MAKNKDIKVKLKAKPKYQWGKRRQMVDNTIYICFAMILYIMFREKDLSIFDTILTNSFMLIGTVIAVYVGGRTVQDIKNPPTEPTDEMPTEDEIPSTATTNKVELKPADKVIVTTENVTTVVE